MQSHSKAFRISLPPTARDITLPLLTWHCLFLKVRFPKICYLVNWFHRKLPLKILRAEEAIRSELSLERDGGSEAKKDFLFVLFSFLTCDFSELLLFWCAMYASHKVIETLHSWILFALRNNTNGLSSKSSIGFGVNAFFRRSSRNGRAGRCRDLLRSRDTGTLSYQCQQQSMRSRAELGMQYRRWW